MKNIKNSLGLKIILPLVISAVIFILTIIIINNRLFLKYAENEINKELDVKVTYIQSIIKKVGREAMWTSANMCEINSVKTAYKTYYRTGDLQSSSMLIEDELYAITTSIYNYTNQNANITFHLPPAKVFLRSWMPMRGDDISSYRKMVLEISDKHKPIHGIESGHKGLVIRALAPIFDENGDYLGSVETVSFLAEVLKNAKMNENQRFAVFMHTDLLSVATKFKDDLANKEIEEVVIGNFILASKTQNDYLLGNIPAEKLNEAMSGIIYFNADSLKYVAFPIVSFNGNIEAIGVLQYNISDMQASTKKITITNVVIGIILIIMIIILIWFFVRIFVTKPIANVISGIKKISNKEINFEIKSKRQDEIGVLYRSLNDINLNFNEIISNIKESATAVLEAGNQLSTISEQVSQSSTEQATSTEEISSSMEEMVATMTSSTEKSIIAGEISTKSASEIKKSNEVFLKTIRTVSEISEKIKIISEIADKTDILSVNASIEAARAGDSGKGFAVVANEIRKLAEITKKASEEINILSNDGLEVSKIAGNNLEKIIPEIIKSADYVNSIVNASKEQEHGAESINISVQQLAEMANESSATSEEMSSSAEELSAQAQHLKDIISVFKTN